MTQLSIERKQEHDIEKWKLLVVAVIQAPIPCKFMDYYIVITEQHRPHTLALVEPHLNGKPCIFNICIPTVIFYCSAFTYVCAVHDLGINIYSDIEESKHGQLVW